MSSKQKVTSKYSCTFSGSMDNQPRLMCYMFKYMYIIGS